MGKMSYALTSFCYLCCVCCSAVNEPFRC